MPPGKQFGGFLLLQNMMLKEFVREGLVSQSLAGKEADRLSRLMALNAEEIVRWDRDLFGACDCAAPKRVCNG